MLESKIDVKLNVLPTKESPLLMLARIRVNTFVAVFPAEEPSLLNDS